MAKSEGKNFEKDLEDSFDKTDITCIRLIDSAKWIQGQGATFTPENKCDFIVFSPPLLYALELKSTKGSSISFNPKEPWNKPEGEHTAVMIKANQVKSLLEFVQKPGVIAGFIFDFRARELKTKVEPNQVFFVHINDFLEYAKLGTSSINRIDCESIGLEIKGKIKKVHYGYDVLSFIENSTNFCIKKGYISPDLIMGKKK